MFQVRNNKKPQTSHRQHLGMEITKVTNEFASRVYIGSRFRLYVQYPSSETSSDHISGTLCSSKRNLFLTHTHSPIFSYIEP
ncbi:hypothetical protein HanIR_Chr16g0815351 [Helianthus annuus]|nr:hypothetical protein HanIR_Chr16g0815351 [Helianthus annuus]